MNEKHLGRYVDEEEAMNEKPQGGYVDDMRERLEKNAAQREALLKELEAEKRRAMEIVEQVESVLEQFREIA